MSITESPGESRPDSDDDQPRRLPVRVFLAAGPAFASSMLAGTGQLAQGQRRLAVVFFITYGAALTAVLLLNGARYFLVFWAVWSVLVLANCISSLHAVWVSPSPPKRASKMLLAPVLVIVSLVSSAFVLNVATIVTGCRVFEVPSTAMEPAIMLGDKVMADMRHYKREAPNRGDVAVFQHDDGIWMAKRIVALAGDSIRGVDNVMWLNAEPLEEPYAVYEGRPPFRSANFGVEKIPVDHVFVMGDNRNVSLDSRHEEHGLVRVNQLKGRVLYVITSAQAERLGAVVE